MKRYIKMGFGIGPNKSIGKSNVPLFTFGEQTDNKLVSRILTNIIVPMAYNKSGDRYKTKFNKNIDYWQKVFQNELNKINSSDFKNVT